MFIIKVDNTIIKVFDNVEDAIKAGKKLITKENQIEIWNEGEVIIILDWSYINGIEIY